MDKPSAARTSPFGRNPFASDNYPAMKSASARQAPSSCYVYSSFAPGDCILSAPKGHGSPSPGQRPGETENKFMRTLGPERANGSPRRTVGPLGRRE